MSDINIGNDFSPYWKVESNMYQTALEGSHKNRVFVDLMTKGGSTVTLKISQNSVEVSGGGFSGSTTRTKEFTNGKGDTVTVTKQ
jgi:hypothetical protein